MKFFVTLILLLSIFAFAESQRGPPGGGRRGMIMQKFIFVKNITKQYSSGPGGGKGCRGKGNGDENPPPNEGENAPENPMNENEEQRMKRQTSHQDTEEFDEQRQPNVWQEVLQIMGEGVKTMFKNVAQKFQEHEQTEGGEHAEN